MKSTNTSIIAISSARVADGRGDEQAGAQNAPGALRAAARQAAPAEFNQPPEGQPNGEELQRG